MVEKALGVEGDDILYVGCANPSLQHQYAQANCPLYAQRTCLIRGRWFACSRDHIYTDAALAKINFRWRTALIVRASHSL